MAARDNFDHTRYGLKTVILACIIPVMVITGGVSILANYLMARDSAVKRVEDHIIGRRQDLTYIAQLPTLKRFVVDLRLGLAEEADFFRQDTETYVADYLKNLSPAFPHTLRVIALDGEELLRIENGRIQPRSNACKPLPQIAQWLQQSRHGSIPLPQHVFPAKPAQRLKDWMPLTNDINKQVIGGIVYEYGIPADKLLSPLNKNLFINAMLALGMVAVFLLVTYWVLERNIRPLRVLTERVQDITDGDMTQPIDPAGSGETRILAGVFETMRHQIKQQIDMLTRNADQLAASLADVQQAQAQLTSERDYTAGIIADSPNLVCGISMQGAITFINPAGTQISGYDASELLGRHFDDILFDKPIHRFLTKVLKADTGERIFNVESDLITRNGEGRTLLWHSVRRVDAQKRLQEVILIGNDVTERKQTEIELAKFRTISDRSQYGSAIYDIEGCLTYINEAYAAMHGYRPDELIGKPQTTFFGRDHADAQRRLHQRLLDQGFLSAEETMHLKKDGSTLPVLINSTLVKNDAGEIQFLSETAIDISERRALEEQLQIRQRMDSLGTLAGGVAHDFNNLLSSVSGYLQLLSLDKEQFSREQQGYIEKVLITVERASDLIRQFQTLSHGSVTKREATDLHVVAEEVITMLSKTTHRMIRKENNIPSDTFYVMGNHTDLMQVFLNLGVNANDAIEAKGVTPNDAIRVEARKTTLAAGVHSTLDAGEYIELIFSDTGCGMSASTKRQAFDPLFSTKKKGTQKGQGLGLAIVYNIIKNHGGHVTIDSRHQYGTRFHILLPASPAGPSAAETTGPMLPGNETILFIDDEKFICEVIRELLEPLGYTVITATDVNALDIYRQRRTNIDLVITDLIMPNLSGEMLVDSILKTNPDEKIIILSGQSEKKISETLRRQVKGFIAKPPEMAALTATLRNVLNTPAR